MMSIGLPRDHVAGSDRATHESWIEWTRTWGVSVRFSDLELRFAERWVLEGTAKASYGWIGEHSRITGGTTLL